MALPPAAEAALRAALAPPPEAGVVGGFVEGNGIVLPDLSLTGLPKTSGGGANLPPLTLIGLPKTSDGGGLARSAGLDIYFLVGCLLSCFRFCLLVCTVVARGLSGFFSYKRSYLFGSH